MTQVMAATPNASAREARDAHMLRQLKRRQMLETQIQDTLTKKQRLEYVSAVAKDVMLNLLAGDISYEPTDAEWDHLVQLTQAHPSFEKQFSFPPEGTEGWVTPSTKKKPSHLKIVALDCEMCVTVSLTSNVRTSNSLCRVSAVDGEDMIRSIIADLIVHQPEPGMRMLDAKTDIHGITSKQIAMSKISVRKAQKRMLKFISADTIVVGHSVYGDLASLRINHRRVIDTAMIYQRMGTDAFRGTPGLKCLTKFLLKFEMPDGHDSTIDAQASMLAAKYAARNPTGQIIPSAVELHGPKQPVVPRIRSTSAYSGPPKLIPTAFQLGQGPMNEASFVAPVAASAEPHTSAETAAAVPAAAAPVVMTEAQIARSCRLRVHRIPKGITTADLQNFFVHNAKVVPTAVEQIVWPPSKKHGSANVTFTTNLHAQLAFDAVQTAGATKRAQQDSIGRAQKVVTIVNGKGKSFKDIRIGVV